MKEQAVFSAPAKINLTLQITGKRPDGYHTLKSVMQSISLCDIVTVKKTSQKKSIEILCKDKNIPCNEKNIAFKAAAKFFEYTGISNSGIEIHIKKNIPCEAGLGGGSADGAAVFAALNKLFDARLTEDELCTASVSCGADIPFCIKGGTMLCEGIGEIMTRLEPIPKYIIVIGKGNEGISTKEAYAKIDPVLENTSASRPEIYIGSDIKKLAFSCFNDFELVSGTAEIAEIKDIMRFCGGINPTMSGSGSAVYGIFEYISEAEICAEKLKERGFFAAVCNTVEHGVCIIK